MCRKGRSAIVADLAAIPRVGRVIWELKVDGSVRGRWKATTLLKILRKWATDLESEELSTTTLSVPQLLWLYQLLDRQQLICKFLK